MPISVKTMRDIWDKQRKEEETLKEDLQLPPGQVKTYKILPLEIKKYYFNHIARKKAFLERKEEIAKIFSNYESRLGEAGFSKI